jgi:hypothetical protein
VGGKLEGAIAVDEVGSDEDFSYLAVLSIWYLPINEFDSENENEKQESPGILRANKRQTFLYQRAEQAPEGQFVTIYL